MGMNCSPSRWQEKYDDEAMLSSDFAKSSNLTSGGIRGRNSSSRRSIINRIPLYFLYVSKTRFENTAS